MPGPLSTHGIPAEPGVELQEISVALKRHSAQP